MKQLILLVILIVIFIVLSIYTHDYLTSSSSILIEKVDKICEYSTNDDWSNALKFSEDSSKIWDETKTTWAKITEHEEIDLIEMSFTKLKAYVKTRDTNEVLVEGSNLKLLLKHIPQKYTLTLENIF